jgi:hypothetical protein
VYVLKLLSTGRFSFCWAAEAYSVRRALTALSMLTVLPVSLPSNFSSPHHYSTLPLFSILPRLIIAIFFHSALRHRCLILNAMVMRKMGDGII